MHHVWSSPLSLLGRCSHPPVFLHHPPRKHPIETNAAQRPMCCPDRVRLDGAGEMHASMPTPLTLFMTLNPSWLFCSWERPPHSFPQLANPSFFRGTLDVLSLSKLPASLWHLHPQPWLPISIRKEFFPLTLPVIFLKVLRFFSQNIAKIIKSERQLLFHYLRFSNSKAILALLTMVCFLLSNGSPVPWGTSVLGQLQDLAHCVGIKNRNERTKQN